jgi:putative SOS response-associated peptidase YedK
MCGRAAQSYYSVQSAARQLGATRNSGSSTRQAGSTSERTRNTSNSNTDANNTANNNNQDQGNLAVAGTFSTSNEECSTTDIVTTTVATEFDDKPDTIPKAANTTKATSTDTTIDKEAENGTIDRPATPNQPHLILEDVPHFAENYNMSPGMDAYIFVSDNGAVTNSTIGTSIATTDRNNNKNNQQVNTCKIRCIPKVWGVVMKNGTSKAPLPEGMSIHFDSMMFNARSDTLYEKQSFSRLLSGRRTCLIAVDGFFEWKTQTGKGNKQPYFVHRSKERDVERPYLLFAGLWNSVSTGRSEPDSEFLHTFTIITTDVCPSLSWLHTRMPLCVWNEADFAHEWLTCPSEGLLRKMERQSTQTPDDYFQWHAVTPQMSKASYRSSEAIKPLPQYKTVKSFFTAKKEDKIVARSTSKEDEIRCSSSKDNGVAVENEPGDSNHVVSSLELADNITQLSEVKQEEMLQGSIVKQVFDLPPKTGSYDPFAVTFETLTRKRPLSSPSPSRSPKRKGGLPKDAPQKKGTLFNFFTPTVKKE